jgi:hypothetical protein
MFFGVPVVPVWIIPGLLRAISAEALGTRLGKYFADPIIKYQISFKK